MKTIKITDSFVSQKPSYDRFAMIQTEIELCDDSDISIFLNIQNRFGFTFVFLFSTLPFLAQKYNKKIKIFCNEKSFYLFKKIGFLNKKCLYDRNKDYCSLLKENANLIEKDIDVFKTVTEITSEAPIKMNAKLSALFISKSGEMYNNALEHSDGIVLGAKYFKNQKNTYCFSCYDTGIGIPQNVIKSIKKTSSHLEAFKWAMVDGNSTVLNGIPRGLGLGALQSFVRANEGSIRICSGNIFYTFKKNQGENYFIINNEFHGTLFEMDIIADNDHEYILK